MTALSGAFLATGFVSHWVIHGSLGDALLAGDAGPAHAFPLVSTVLYIAAALSGAWYVLPKAWVALRRIRPDMNLLMTVAVVGAVVIGERFEAGTVAFLFALSLLLESWSVRRARRAVAALMELSPLRARVVCKEHGHEEMVPVEKSPSAQPSFSNPGRRCRWTERSSGGRRR